MPCKDSVMAADKPTPTVTVWGEARLRTEPDEAVLWLTLSALEDAPGAALSDVASRGAALVALLDGFGVAKADRSTTGITVAEEHDHTESGRHLLGHRATSHMSVRLADPAQVGELVARATDEVSAGVRGPHWLISLDNPVRLEAARRAAADAEQKARAYAEGIGAGLGPLIRLSEFGDSHGGREVVRAQALSAGSGQPMPVEAGEQAVTASIEATFALELD
jgi:uncharacterized protein YggE